MTDKPKETWESGEGYEQYSGRWSRKVGKEFLAWLKVSPGQVWGDVGCGLVLWLVLSSPDLIQ